MLIFHTTLHSNPSKKYCKYFHIIYSKPRSLAYDSRTSLLFPSFYTIKVSQAHWQCPSERPAWVPVTPNFNHFWDIVIDWCKICTFLNPLYILFPRQNAKNILRIFFARKPGLSSNTWYRLPENQPLGHSIYITRQTDEQTDRQTILLAEHLLQVCDAALNMYRNKHR